MSTKHKIFLSEGAVDFVVLYSFLKKLTTPFEQWDAYKLGIIDDEGKVLRKRATLTEPDERRAFTLFDILVLNIKKMVHKLPGGKSRLATFIAGLFLIKEQTNIEYASNEDILYEAFMDFYDIVFSDPKLKKEVELLMRHPALDLDEDAPTTSVSAGGVAGLTVATGGPIISKDTLKKIKRKNFNEYLEERSDAEQQDYIKSLQLKLSKDNLTDKQLKDFAGRSNGFASSPAQISAIADINAMLPNHLEQIISQKRVHVFMKHHARQRLSKKWK